MLNSYVGRNVPRCRTRWTMGVKKIRKLEKHSRRPNIQLTSFRERENRENREKKIINDIIKKCFRIARYQFPDLKRLQ